MLLIVLLVLTLTEFSFSFLIKSGLNRFNNKLLSSVWQSNEWNDDSYNDIDLPVLEDTIKIQLEKLVDNFISSSTIKTVSYYMLEFKNDLEYQWIMGFKNCGDDAFNTVSFAEYIEGMIALNRQEIEVIMDAPKMYMKKVDPSRRSLARLQYFHSIEPRKLANQIVSVREDISNEMIVDLGCIKLEHIEAVRYAHIRVKNGEEEAERLKKLTRLGSPSGSTPYRERSYYDFAILLTNVALDVIKGELIANGNDIGIKYIDNILTDVVKLEQTYIDKLGLTGVNNVRVPNFVLSEMYHRGLKYGLIEENGQSFNSLKLAQKFLSIRLAIALQANENIVEQTRVCRKYFTMIKQYGGFSRLDFSTPKMEVVYIDDLERLDKEKLNKKLNESNSTNTNTNAVVKTVVIDNHKEVNTISTKLQTIATDKQRERIVTDNNNNKVIEEESNNKELVDSNIIDWQFNDFGPMSM